MAKKQEAPCLFCGGLPCTCDGGQRKRSSARTRKASSPAVKKTIEKSLDSTPSSPATEASTEDVFGEIPKQVTPKFKSKPASETPVDLSSLSALRIIREIVCPRDQKRIDDTLKREYPQELDRRVAEWKTRHGDKA